MGSKFGDLDKHLFAALERLNEPGLTAEQITSEAMRAEAIVGIADQVIEAAKVKVAAAKIYAEHGSSIVEMLPQIGRSAE